MTKHDQDFYGWTQDTVELLKQRRLAEVDVDALIEEVEDMGANVWNQLDSRMSVLLAHLLKWQYQPTHRGKSWQLTIRDQRYRIGRLLQKNPSLTPKLEETKEAMYPSAVLSAAKETDLEVDQFPDECPWTVTQVLDDEFYPRA